MKKTKKNSYRKPEITTKHIKLNMFTNFASYGSSINEGTLLASRTCCPCPVGPNGCNVCC